MERQEKRISSSDVESVLNNCYQSLTMLRHGFKSLSDEVNEEEITLGEVGYFLFTAQEMIDSMHTDVSRVKGKIPSFGGEEGGEA